MKITRVLLENIRCFRYLDLDLSTNKLPNEIIVLLGDNGVGKSTLMRCIALCLCEESSAAGLIDEITNDWVRKDDKKKEALIRIEFEKSPLYKHAPYIETTIIKTRFGETDVDQVLYPKISKFWDKLFVCGYGANRRSYGTTSYNEYTVADAVYSMFNYQTDMQNIELNIRRIDKEINVKLLFNKIEEVLTLDHGAIQLDRSGINIKGPWGSYMPIGTLGDGYQSVIAWIMDMYGWKLLYEKELEDAEITGIVFIDELEQHLHPLWQKEIVRNLQYQFPKVQFIITTHSPIIAMNSCSLDKKFNSKKIVLKWEGNKVEASEVSERLNDLGYDQLLGSEAFGHIYSQNSEVDKLLEDMSILASRDKLGSVEKELLEKLKSKLKDIMFPEGRTLIERIVEREYYSDIEKRTYEFNELIKTHSKHDPN